MVRFVIVVGAATVGFVAAYRSEQGREWGDAGQHGWHAAFGALGAAAFGGIAYAAVAATGT